MIGRKLAHFKLTAKLGEGGMGEVWRATDLKLKREAALKVLPADVASDPERLERFRREAQAIAALSHPNILSIYSVEEAEGHHLLVMELVDGQNLGELVPPSGVELARFLDLAIQIADAVAAAHEEGIVHRDLKPANVMVTARDQVKVLDFGLAKLAAGVGEEDDETLMMTRTGAVMGTVLYMSPEQAQGQPIDSRSDIFALGALLYEMATGERPFHADSKAAVISAILRDEPPPVTAINAKLPNQLARIVRRCLEKDPELRYQSATSVRHELEVLRDEIRTGSLPPAAATAVSGHGREAPGERGSEEPKWKWPVAVAVAAVVLASGWWVLSGRRDPEPGAPSSPSGVEATSQPTRLVVLPFENLGDPGDEYFAAGMTDEITNRLAAMQGLAVISRKSALQYADTEKTIAEIGSELGVAYVLEGSVRWARTAEGESQVRITPRLVTVETGTYAWSDVLERDFRNVFYIQSEIAETVAARLDATMVAGGEVSKPQRPTESSEAYEAFLRGGSPLIEFSYTADDFDRSVRSFRQAVELDPNFAAAWARLSYCHTLSYHFGYDVSEERLALARAALDEALRLAPDAGETHLARGYYHYHALKQYEQALVHMRAARVELPDPTAAILAEGYVLRAMALHPETSHRLDESIQRFELALERNPRDPSLYFDLGDTQRYAGRYADAIKSYELSEAVRSAGNYSGTMMAKTQWLWRGRRGLADAKDALERSGIDRDHDYFHYYYHWQLIYEGDLDEALAFLDEGVERGWIKHPQFNYPWDLPRAWVLEWAGRGEEARAAYTRAARELELAIEEQPENHRLYGPLGMAYAGLGRHDEALAAAGRGHEIRPGQAEPLWRLAAIHARFGDAEAALAQYETLIRDYPYQYSPAFLELDVFMDPVRDHPRYRALVEDL